MKDRVKFFLIFGISLLLIGSIGMSFALFTTDTERKGALNIVAVNTSCPLESEALNKNNQITLGANEQKIITVKLTNTSLFDVKSIITYTGTDVEVTYDAGSKDNIAIEELPINEQREITLYIKNNSSNEQVVTINAKCGFVGKDIILEDDETQVDKEHTSPPATLRSWTSDSSDDFHNSTYKSKVTSVEFKINTSEVPSNPIKTWSVKDTTSEEEVTAYLLDDGLNAGTYKVIISTSAPILFANSDSSYMFGSLSSSNSFSSLKEIKGLELLDTSKVTDMSYMFRECSQLSTITGIDGWDTSNVKNMQSMFGWCNSLSDLSSISSWVTSRVTNMSSMFSLCSQLTSVGDLSGWDTSHVTTMYGLFSECSQLTDLSSISSWVTSRVTTMTHMFSECSQLTSLDLSRWDTLSVTDMSYMFYNCSQLSTITGIDGWDTSSVKNMQSMFGYCSQLTTLDLSRWDTSGVTNMSSMFYRCSQLSTTITILGNVTNYSSMFYGAATASKASITVNYTSANQSVVQAMVNTQSYNSHVYMADSPVPEYDVSIVNNVNVIANPSRTYANTKVTLECTLENKLVSSFKLNGTQISGNTFKMPEGGAIITDIVLIDGAIVESSHNPYDNSANTSIEKTFAGAKSLTVILEYETQSSSSDYVQLYDSPSSSTPLDNKKYGGTTRTTETITINGDYVKITFKTNASGNNYYGYKAIITPNY